MIINHPLLGLRDAAEFTILGDANLLNRPDWQTDDADDAFYSYQYLRDNRAGLHRELWFHEQGDRSWLVVTRDTLTHVIVDVALAKDVAFSARVSKASQASKTSKSAEAANAAKKSKAKNAKKTTMPRTSSVQSR